MGGRIMNIAPEPNRMEELLAEEAVFGLNPTDRTELDQLLSENPSAATIEFEQAAAAYYMAAAPLEIESMPEPLRTKVLTNCLDSIPSVNVSSGTKQQPSNLASWIIAIAAGLLIGFFLRGVNVEPPVLALAAQRASLLDSTADVLKLDWTATDAPEAQGATGDIVWSNAKQEGYMTFRGLKVNDPTQEQYQLWVFDAERDERYPVDGGVFDIPADAKEVITPINTKINVIKATLFAITIEKPGGVVVSDCSRLPLLAKVE